MTQDAFKQVTPGVLKIEGNEIGPEIVEYEGIKYFRFMDFFYIRTENLDELAPGEVSNLCRARALYPDLISDVNVEVRMVFKMLADAMSPMNLLEIGAGYAPVYNVGDVKPGRYMLADADIEVVNHHTSLSNECYVFSPDTCQLPTANEYLDMVIAVFVLHFPFNKSQLSELNKRLRSSGVLVANVYRRSKDSRELLAFDILSTGLKIIKVPDENNLCRNHEYWIIGKEDVNIKNCATVLREILMR